MSALAVISLLALSVHWYSTEQVRRTRRLSEIQATNFLARSAIAFAIGTIAEEIQDPASSIFQVLCSPTLATGTAITFDLSPLTDMAASLREAQVTALDVRVDRIEPLDRSTTPTTGGVDPVERNIVLALRTTCIQGGSTTTLEEKREVRIAHLMPGILGKFTLYVRDVGTNPEAFNAFPNDINGLPDDRSIAPKCLPVVLKNGGALDEGAAEGDDPENYRLRGFIYLGGGRVNLNLTSGNSEAYGEHFHFFPLRSSLLIPGYYHLSPPEFFSASFAEEDLKRVPQMSNPTPPFAAEFAYCLKHTISGFFTTDDFGKGLAQDGMLGVSVPEPVQACDPRLFSSVLHLFGNRTNPSPTLVLGDVHRRYADLCGILVEATGNGNRDAVAAILTEIADSVGLETLSTPATVEAMKRADVTEGTPILLEAATLSFPDMFGSREAYRAAMSRLVTEPYLRSFDYLYFKEPGEFHPRTTLFGTGEAVPQQTFSLAFHPSVNGGADFYKDGQPGDVPLDLLADKASFRVPDMDRFRARFLDPQGRLQLNAVVLVGGKAGQTSVLNDRELTVRKGGIIILTHGNLDVSAIRIGADPDESLTLCALNGDIQVDLSHGKIQARLIALRGKIVNKTPTMPLDLDGGIAVKEFPPSSFREGGRIGYDSQADPSSAEWDKFYRLFIADVPVSVEESH